MRKKICHERKGKLRNKENIGNKVINSFVNVRKTGSGENEVKVKER